MQVNTRPVRLDGPFLLSLGFYAHVVGYNESMAALQGDEQDADVPEQAIRALSAAHRRALNAGRTLVLVHNGQLVRVTPQGRTVIGEAPAKQKVRLHSNSAKR